MAHFRMVITYRRIDEAHVVVEGPIREAEARQIAALLATAVDVGARQLFVDLARIDSCDQRFLIRLDRLRHRLISIGGWMVVDGAPATLAEDTSTLDEIFTTYRHVTGLQPPLEATSGPLPRQRTSGARLEIGRTWP